MCARREPAKEMKIDKMKTILLEINGSKMEGRLGNELVEDQNVFKKKSSKCKNRWREEIDFLVGCFLFSSILQFSAKVSSFLF